MACCVISAIADGTDGDVLVSACFVHACLAPCPRDGEPASTAPLHAFSREDALPMWETCTRRQRPLIIHYPDPDRDPAEHVIGKDITPCWCGAQILPARES